MTRSPERDCCFRNSRWAPGLSAEFPNSQPHRERDLSLGVLIVEGAQHSGSAITAKLAMDQGREVFAVPGNITSKMSWGPNLLIKQGAKLVQEWSDITNELPAAVRRELVDRAQQKMLLEMAVGPCRHRGTGSGTNP